MRSPSRLLASTALALAAAAFAACSPTFNWREVPIADDGLVALLPCKPDRATRALPLRAESVSVDMTGCQAGGATFAIAHATAGNAAQAEGWMRAWRAATRSQLEGTPLTETDAALPRSAASPAPSRLDTRDAVPGKTGQGVPTHVLWFAQARAGKVSLYQATILGQPSAADAMATFFEGLRLP